MKGKKKMSEKRDSPGPGIVRVSDVGMKTPRNDGGVGDTPPGRRGP
jgi:hypothetical protein